MNRKVLKVSLIAALGGLLFGFDTAVISGTTEALTKVFSLTPSSLGFTVAIALIGTILGAVFVGYPANSYGRKNTLKMIALLYFFSSLGTAMAWNWGVFLTFRFLGGIAVGASSVVAPMYIAEIVPASFRGRMVALAQFNVVFGILLAFFSNLIISNVITGPAQWRCMLGILAVPSIIFFGLLYLIPFSPRWLASKGRVEEAGSIIKYLAGPEDNAEKALKEIVDSIKSDSQSKNEKLFSTKYTKVILLAVAIAAFNQLSGINAVLYYAPYIFKMAGAGTNAALIQSVVVGFTNLIFTMAALLVIDKLGRRKLMLTGSLGYIVSLGALTVIFAAQGSVFSPLGGALVLASLVVFIASHAFGQGAVIWVFISEIFPTKVRAQGSALGSFTHWIMAAVISWTFPIFANISGAVIFGVYTFFMVLQLLWVIFIMPETKGIPLEKMTKELGIE
ncbi:Sugar transport family [Elusimicrobium minutum Pei191]|uniref:Sugar transport family n=1 Tax=Elusimicrobium minutum (strain Pei191) TaxID=445932 RepID=B2KBA3_ELUMP|nr:sugar porter family MFS transporter [Elusimicrobium minutum]ACC97925.1 Sugar transport family [Elusimicrobium minutum Pei191]